MNNKPCLHIGITGGIGTGKSTVCKIFQVLGIPVYDADTRAKVLMNTDSTIKNKIISKFGAEAYNAAGLDRRYLAQKVFNNENAVADLNAIVHPAVGEDFKNWARENANHPYLIKEAALMFESGSDKLLDAVITVTAPLDLRIKRIRLRDPQRTEEEIKGIISKQMPEEEKIKRAKFILHNDEKSLLIPQVLEIHKTLIG